VPEEKFVEKQNLVKTADNVIIVFDGSHSTNGLVPGTKVTKIAAAKEILRQSDKWMPDLDYNCGVYITSGWSALKTVWPVQKCNREALAPVIEKLPEKGKGNDLLLQSMYKLEKIIEPLSGRTAVIWFTDNIVNDIDGIVTPADIAKRITAKKDVGFLIINADEDLKNGALTSVASVNSDSKAASIKTFMDRPTELAAAISTTRMVSSVAKVPTSQVIGFVTDNMLFDVNSTAIRSEYTQELDQVGRFLKAHPEIAIVIQGHTDSVGPDKYNLSLSAKRAGQVREYLLEKFELDPKRVAALWYGDKNPVADNATAKGRQLNRRVEIAARAMKSGDSSEDNN